MYVRDASLPWPLPQLNFILIQWYPEDDVISFINHLTWSPFSCSYDIQLDIIRLDFKSGLEALLKANPIRAIFLGVRIGDPTAVNI